MVGSTRHLANWELDLIGSRADDKPEVRRVLAASTVDDAFAELVRTYSRFVFQVAHAVVRHHHDAEDVAQEVFLRVYRSHAWERMEEPKAFLARAAWRLAVDRVKQRHTHGESAVEPASTAATPEQLAVRESRDHLLHQIIDALPEELRQPLVLSALDGLSSKEIGVMMNLPEGTVRTRTMRARQMVKEKFQALTASKGGSR